MTNCAPFQLIRLFLICALLVVTGCATTKSGSTSLPNAEDSSNAQVEQQSVEHKDPFERSNRAILKFNLKADKYVLKPITKTYAKYTPKPVKKGVRNFFSNLWEPTTVINDLLQAKFSQAVRDTTRFVINTTVGVLGIFDVASRLDLTKNKEDFGQSMAVWGIPAGPYLMLPLLGPSNIRDTVGLVPQYLYTDLLSGLDSSAEEVARAIRVVDGRSKLLGVDDLLDLQLDPYIFIRERYQQQRRQQILDAQLDAGDTALSSEQLLDDELLEDELLEDELLDE